METVTLSSKYELIVPRGACERLALRPGAVLTVVDKGGILFLIPERPMRGYRGLVKRESWNAAIRDKKERF